MPVSGLVVTFESSVTNHGETIGLLSTIAEIELGEAGGSRLALVIDSATKRRDQEIWNTIEQLPGVIDLAVAMIVFDDDADDDDDDAPPGPYVATNHPLGRSS